MNKENGRFFFTTGLLTCLLSISLFNTFELSQPIIVESTTYNYSSFFSNNQTIIYNQTHLVQNTLIVRDSLQCQDVTLKDMKPIEVQGMSMQPAIYDGDTVLVVEYNKDLPIVQGDIIRMQFDDWFMIHQVIAVYDIGVITKGLNNDVNDDMISYDQITGVVCGVLY